MVCDAALIRRGVSGATGVAGESELAGDRRRPVEIVVGDPREDGTSDEGLNDRRCRERDVVGLGEVPSAGQTGRERLLVAAVQLVLPAPQHR